MATEGEDALIKQLLDQNASTNAWKGRQLAPKPKHVQGTATKVLQGC